MLTRIWDWLFTRRTWTIIHDYGVFQNDTDEIPYARIYVMKDQFGNIKKKRIN